MFKTLFKRKRKGFVYKLLDDFVSVDMLGVWEKHLLHFSKVVGYSATGTLFLFSPETKEFLAFYPSQPGNNSKYYGVFDNLAAFEEKILKDKDFPEFGLYPIKPEDLKYLEDKLGTLDEHQIYFPKLDPALGGSLSLDGFTKGDIWIRTDILGQNRGIE